MAITAHLYQRYLQASAEEVWRALIEPDWTERYFHSTRFAEPPVAGHPYRTVMISGATVSEAVSGEIRELSPPTATAPGRLVQTWQAQYDEELAAEPPSLVTWTVVPVGERLTRLELVHGELAFSPLTWARVKDGWVWILDALKTLLETGEQLSRPTLEAPREADSGEPESPDWHRRQGVEANNAAYPLLTEPSSPERDEELLRTAYAAAYHWQRAANQLPANQARADYVIAKALVATGQAERALVSARRMLAQCEEHGLGDFDLAYAHEVMARAHGALGEPEESARHAQLALGVPIADQEDRAIVEADLADLA